MQEMEMLHGVVIESLLYVPYTLPVARLMRGMLWNWLMLDSPSRLQTLQTVL